MGRRDSSWSVSVIISNLIEDEDLRKSMGRKAKERSVLFSVDSVMQRWTELFSSLIARKKKH